MQISCELQTKLRVRSSTRNSRPDQPSRQGKRAPLTSHHLPVLDLYLAITTSSSITSKMARASSSNNVNNILRGSLTTMPGPGGAGSIGHYVQPCRKVVLSYCASSPASAGVRDWLTKQSGAVQLAKQWPQIEWVVKEGKRGSEPHVAAHYGG